MFGRYFTPVLVLSTLLNVSTAQINTQQMALLLFKVMMKLPNSECKNQLLMFRNAVDKSEQWALSNATAKPQPGLLMGNVMHVGNYPQCLKIDETVDSKRIQGKYCTGLFQPNSLYTRDLNDWISEYIYNTTNIDIGDRSELISFLFSYGFCVPKACTVVNLQSLADLFEQETQSPVHFIFKEEYCFTSEPRPLPTSAIAGMAVFASFGAIIVLSTLYEIFCGKEQNLCTAFSALTNTKKLLSTSTSEGNLKCLNGLRVISMMWIVVGHEVQNTVFAPHTNFLDLSESRQHLQNSFVFANSIAVDTFFTIGGLLVVYLFMMGRDKGAKFNVPMFYLHRILRLTPSLGMLILFYNTVYNYIGDGPFWPVIKMTQIQPCERNWWSTLIYLQNYINPTDECLDHAWYLAVDTQMYFLSPLIFFPLVKWPKYTIGAVITFTVLNCAYVFEITWKKHLSTIFLEGEQIRLIYGTTHVRGTVYLLGMICGYFVYKTRTEPLKLSKVMVLILWICSISVLAAIVLGYGLEMPLHPYDPLAASFFNSLTRVSWSISVSVVTILCVNGYGGLINTFLSNKIFTLLIRLNYNIYLLHIPIIMLRVAQQRVPTYYSTEICLFNFWGDYAFSVAAAVIWTLAFESPVLNLEKVIFGRGNPRSEVNEKTVKQSVAV